MTLLIGKTIKIWLTSILYLSTRGSGDVQVPLSLLTQAQKRPLQATVVDTTTQDPPIVPDTTTLVGIGQSL